MIKTIRISNRADLIQFIEDNDLSLAQLNNLTFNTIGGIFLNKHSKKKLIEFIKMNENTYRILLDYDLED